MLVLITYDIKNPDKDYSSLYEAIKNCGTAWWHHIESVWIVKTDMSPRDCFNRIRECFTEEDCCFVVDITQQPREGWLPANAWKWIRDNE